VLAERLAIIVSVIYGGGTEEQMGTVTYAGAYIIIGAFAYVFQLYTDFSGCMDMVIGVAQMFGIKLPENFHTPFYATSLSEFWRRWHITLGAWLKDYVLYPTLKSAWLNKIRKAIKAKFGKKAAKEIPTYIGMFITWFGIGFWHGGSWKYICASGLFFFVMIVGGLILAPVFKRLTAFLRIDTGAWSWTLFARLRTACLFTLSVSFGRASSLTTGFKMWRRAFEWNPWIWVDGSLYNLGLDRLDFWVMVFGMAALFVVSKFQQSGSIREKVAGQNIVFRWTVYLGLFVAVLLFGMYGQGYNPADFIYGGF
jgi:D-alanyl-lipoteichoic acid acyltransferase DltB (MBOAT superfamily)